MRFALGVDGIMFHKKVIGPVLAVLLLSVGGTKAAPLEVPKDAYPLSVRSLTLMEESPLVVEPIIGKLKVVWRPKAGLKAIRDAEFWYSLGPPGRWKGRHWEKVPLKKRGIGMETWLPVDSIEVPLLCLVKVTLAGGEKVLPMEEFIPGALGLEAPTRAFWPFLEGFEEGGGRWRVSGSGRAAVVAGGHSGKHSLGLSLHPDRSQETVSTSLIQGWHFDFQNAEGLRIWARSKEAGVKVRLLLETEAQEVTLIPHPSELDATSSWTALDFDLLGVKNLVLGDIVRVHFAVVAPPGGTVQFDDLQLLGKWVLDRQ